MTAIYSRFSSACALLALLLLGVSPTQAQPPPPGRLPTWAVLDFANHSGYGGAEMGRLASDAFQVELNKVNRYEIIPRQDVQQGLSTLNLTLPLNIDNVQRMGRSLSADAVVTGEVASVAFTNNPRRAKVGLVIRVVDTRSGELINGALAEGQSNLRAVPTNDDDVLTDEALDNAAFAAIIRQILRFNLPCATVISNNDANMVTLNRGARDGLYAGLNMLVVRGGFVAGNSVTGGTVIGHVRVGALRSNDTDAIITDRGQEIRADDRAVAIYHLPLYSIDRNRIHASKDSVANDVDNGQPRQVKSPAIQKLLNSLAAQVDSMKAARKVADVAQKIAPSDNQFGFDLLGKMDKSGGNVFFSPASLALALAMTYNGAGGKTREAMEATLHLQGMTVQEVNEANAALMQSLADPEPVPESMLDNVRRSAGMPPQLQTSFKKAYQNYLASRPHLEIANAIWADKRAKFAPDFQQRVQQSYQAEAATLDFQSPSAAPTINAWVSKHTQGMIDSIISPPELSQDVIVLTNAVYFKSQWTHVFEAAATKDGLFTRPDGTTKTLPLMTQSEYLSYLETKDFQAVRLPYGRGRLAMYVFLPRKDGSLAQFAQTLNAQTWEGWLTQFKTSGVNIILPRFTADYGADLIPVLRDLGMGPVFGAGADFRPMGVRGAFISQVKHKAVVKVDEKGTEAAAVSFVGASLGGHSPPPNPIIMRVDRPFFCAIRDNATGLVLFLGLIEDPKP